MMLLVLVALLSRSAFGLAPVVVPKVSLSGAENRVWPWKDYSIRYVHSEPAKKKKKKKVAVVLVHGLFVNADHWRYTAPALCEEGYSVYALDMLGSGYSSKPDPKCESAKKNSGERRLEEDVVLVEGLGTASGKLRAGRVAVPQRHPLNSPYNFYTWAEEVSDFLEDIVLKEDDIEGVAMICNSIGCITGLLAAIAKPEVVRGVACVAPNFRELHVSENPKLAQPITEAVQRLLRETQVGKWLFEKLATPDTVKQILKEPYHDLTNVDDALVDALLTPLQLPGAREVVFDALSYSAGPLPEQLLQHPNLTDVPIWISLGLKDPWTPKKRIAALNRFDAVKQVDLLDDCGHCPHDERPDIVNPLLLSFLASIDENDTGGDNRLLESVHPTTTASPEAVLPPR